MVEFGGNKWVNTGNRTQGRRARQCHVEDRVTTVAAAPSRGAAARRTVHLKRIITHPTWSPQPSSKIGIHRKRRIAQGGDNVAVSLHLRHKSGIADRGCQARRRRERARPRSLRGRPTHKTRHTPGKFRHIRAGATSQNLAQFCEIPIGNGGILENNPSTTSTRKLTPIVDYSKGRESRNGHLHQHEKFMKKIDHELHRILMAGVYHKRVLTHSRTSATKPRKSSPASLWKVVDNDSERP